jgi:shikimate kinase
LHGQPAALHERVRQDKNRPLLAAADPLARLEALYRERDPLYREVADIVIDTGRQSVQSLARQLLGQLRESWKLSA